MPYDTGNLRANAFQYSMNGRECEFYIDLDIAPYSEYLEDGTGRGSEKHKGFWERVMKESINEVALEYQAHLENYNDYNQANF